MSQLSVAFVSNATGCEREIVQNSIELAFNATVFPFLYDNLLNLREQLPKQCQCIVVVIPANEEPMLLDQKARSIALKIPKIPMIWIRSSENLSLYSIQGITWIKVIDTNSYRTGLNFTEEIFCHIEALTCIKRVRGMAAQA